MNNCQVNPINIMGILNITPDSFSDGNKYMQVEKAVNHAYSLIEQGADIIDIGAESTRPNSVRITWETEFARLQPVLSALRGINKPISIDTMNSKTALACLDYGVEIINDVSGGLYDDQIYKVIADNNVNYICQHWRVNMNPIEAEKYWKLTHDVMHELYLRLGRMREAGIKDDKVIVDPGLGFYKNHGQSWELLNKVDQLKQLGLPILIGASRKRMTVLNAKDNIEDRDKVTAKISVFCAEHNLWGVRVHNVALTKQYLDERFKKMIFDKICIKGISGKGYHGFYDIERAVGQNFHIDVVMEIDTTFTYLTDNLEKTVNYEKVGNAVVEVIEGESVKLIETLAERIALVILEFEHVFQVTVTVHKPEAPLNFSFKDIQVTITRNRANLKIEKREDKYYIKGTNIRDEQWSFDENGEEKPLHEIKDIEEDISALDDLNIDFPKELLKTLNNDSTKIFEDEPEEKTELIEVNKNDENFAPIFHPEKADVILALGANLGYPAQVFQDVISDLDKALGFEVIDVSPLVKNKAHTLDGKPQPDYYNCVLRGKTFLSQETLLNLTQEVEEYFGRKRDEKWASRLIDIDIISYNNVEYNDGNLIIPHPLARERNFVLLPWVLMDPEAKLGEDYISDILAGLSNDGIIFVWDEWLGKSQEDLENILMQNIHDSIDDKGYGNELDLESLSSLAVNEDLEFENFSEDGIKILDEGIDVFADNDFEVLESNLANSSAPESEYRLPEVQDNNVNSGINFVIKNAEETLQSEDTHYSDNLDLKEDDEFSDENLFEYSSANTGLGNSEALQNHENKEVLEALHTMEHHKVMNQLRTLFAGGVEDEVALVDTNGKSNPKIITLDRIKTYDSIKDEPRKIKENFVSANNENDQNYEPSSFENLDEDNSGNDEKNARYLSVASNLVSTSNENPIVSSPLVTVENLPKIEVDNKKYDDLSNKNLHNESSVSNSKYFDDIHKPYESSVSRETSYEGVNIARLIKEKEEKKLIEKRVRNNKVKTNSVNEQTQEHNMDFEEDKANMYEILRKKTFDEVTKSDDKTNGYSFKPNWQSIVLGEK